MRIRLLVFLSFFCCFCSYAQEVIPVAYKNTGLKEMLKDVETKTSLLFSYAPEMIAGKKISLPKQKISIDKLLSELMIQTGLVFEKVSSRQIIITKTTQLCGYVKDGSSNEYLPYVTVVVDSVTYATTNTAGYFSFEHLHYSTKSKTIKINSFGYKPIEKVISTDDGCGVIELQPISLLLDEVVVLGYVTTGIDRNKDGSIDITTEKLGILPGLLSHDIAQSIQTVPGISTLDESATGIQIRGGSPDQNLILYDDIKLYNTGYFYGMFSLFNPFAIQKASIFRSGTSANYGDRISGIIDISSGEKIPKKTQGGAEVDALAINGYIKTPLSKKVGVYLFARNSYTAILKTPTYTSYAKKIFSNAGEVRDINGNVLDLETDDDFNLDNSNNNFSFTDINAKVIIKPNAKNDFAISGLYTYSGLGFDFQAGEEKSVDDLTTKNKGVSIKWHHRSSEKQQEEVSTYYTDYNSFYQNDELEDKTGDGNLDVTKISIRENMIRELGANFTSTTQTRQNQQLKLGYQLSNTHLIVGIKKNEPFETDGNESLTQDRNNLKNAVFGEYTFNLKNKGMINTGLRLVHYSSLHTFMIEPRINFEYPITKHLRLKTAIERRNQPISQLVEFNNTELRLENNLWRLSDGEDFPLLSSNQLSGGLLYKNKNFTIDFDSYFKDLNGLTTFTSGFSNPLENLEKGKSTIKGFDVLLKYKYNSYKIWAGYTFNDIRFQFPNLENTPSRFPGNNDIRHQFSISNTLSVKKWQLSLGWQIRSGKPVTPVNSYEVKIDADGENAGVVNFGAINSDRLPVFHRLDASVLYSFTIGKEKAQLGVSAINLYNRVKPLEYIYKAEVKPLDDGGIAKPGTTGSTVEDRELILEQVIQRFSLGFTPNVVFRVIFK